MKLMNLLMNLTPHAIHVQTPDGAAMSVPPSGHVARVSSIAGRLLTGYDLPCPVYASPTFGAVVGLPDPDGETVYIVSGMVLGLCVGRSDVVGPGTGPADGAIRDGGKIVAVTRFIAAPTE